MKRPHKSQHFKWDKVIGGVSHQQPLRQKPCMDPAIQKSLCWWLPGAEDSKNPLTAAHMILWGDKSFVDFLRPEGFFKIF